MFSFQKKHRILSSKEFLSILKTRPRIHGQFFRIYLYISSNSQSLDLNLSADIRLPSEISAISNNLSHQLRLGLVIPKRLCKKANKRNLIKRQLRENFRLHILPLQHKDQDQQHKANAQSITQINIVFYLSKKLPDQIDQKLLNLIKEDISQLNQKIKHNIKKYNPEFKNNTK